MKNIQALLIVVIFTGITGFLIAKTDNFEIQNPQSRLTAGILDITDPLPPTPPISNGSELAILYAQFLDWSYDLVPGLSPEITSRGNIEFPTRTKSYVQYSLLNTFPLRATTKVLIPTEYIRVEPSGSYVLEIPAEDRFITLLPEKTYYIRLMMQDVFGQKYSQTTKLITPENCIVEFIPGQVSYGNGGLRGGTQTIASFTVKNNCLQPVFFVDAEFSVHGLSVSNPNLPNNNVVSNIKVYTGSTLLSQPTKSWMRYDFRNTAIPALGIKSFTIKADVPVNITQGDYLATRIELRGTTPGTSNPQSPSAFFVNTRGFAPSVTIGTNTYWYMKY